MDSGYFLPRIRIKPMLRAGLFNYMVSLCARMMKNVKSDNLDEIYRQHILCYRRAIKAIVRLTI